MSHCGRVFLVIRIANVCRVDKCMLEMAENVGSVIKLIRNCLFSCNTKDLLRY